MTQNEKKRTIENADRRFSSQLFEGVVHGIFLILGLIAVGFVLLITIYLVVACLLYTSDAADEL